MNSLQQKHEIRLRGVSGFRLGRGARPTRPMLVAPNAPAGARRTHGLAPKAQPPQGGFVQLLPRLQPPGSAETSITRASNAMSPRQPAPLPTDAELRILRVLWERGPSTVREVCDRLNAERETGYTTVLKFLQIMLEKGLVDRDDAQRTHVYRAAVEPDETRRELVEDLADRAFGGSAMRLVMQALSATPASADELAQVRRLLDELERGHAG